MAAVSGKLSFEYFVTLESCKTTICCRWLDSCLFVSYSVVMCSVYLFVYNIVGLTVSLTVRGIWFVAVPTLYQYVILSCDKMTNGYVLVC